jgi:hypothetical protein
VRCRREDHPVDGCVTLQAFQVCRNLCIRVARSESDTGQRPWRPPQCPQRALPGALARHWLVTLRHQSYRLTTRRA